jgi:hypothetical protein
MIPTCVPVVEGEACDHVLTLLEHLVAANEASNLPLAVLHQPPNTRLCLVIGPEHDDAQIQL